jgi:hypothetical protein
LAIMTAQAEGKQAVHGTPLMLLKVAANNRWKAPAAPGCSTVSLSINRVSLTVRRPRWNLEGWRL